MGYNTYMSLPKRPLPNRTNIVLTRKDIALEGAHVVNSIDALKKSLETLQQGEVFIIGGAQVYEQFMPLADRLYITHIFETFTEAEKFFPVISDEWHLKGITADRENIEHAHPHVFAVYERTTTNA